MNAKRRNIIQKESAQTFDLERYNWKNRLLFAFAPSIDHPSVKLQRQKMKEQSPDMAERDLVMIGVFEKAQSRAGDLRVDGEAAAALREKFKIEAGRFTVLLIGKDGTEKFRALEPVTPAQIFGLIDSMPMRGEEIKQRQGQRGKNDAHRDGAR